jgi:DNA-directed RNA polymerase subunit RPC12/RpoP
MYEDDKLFPILCPGCSHKFKQQVGRMKTGGELLCPQCGIKLRYEVKEFLRVLGEARRGLYDFSGDFLIVDAAPKLKH